MTETTRTTTGDLAAFHGATGLPVGTAATHLSLPDDLTLDEWATLGPILCGVERSGRWWLGDWIRYAEDRADAPGWGSKYLAAIEMAGLSYSSLANVVWVAGRVEVSRRREDLSWSHHLEVAKLRPDEQVAWLARAALGDPFEEEDGSVVWRPWATRQLRAEIQKAGTVTVKEVKPAGAETPDAATPTPVTVSIEVAPELAAEVATLRPILEHWRASGTITAAAFELLSRMVDAAEKASGGKAGASSGRGGRAAA